MARHWFSLEADGDPSGPTQPGAQWDGGWTNELHTFELEEGEGVQLEV